MDPNLDLKTAISITLGQHARSSQRQRALADYCIAELEKRGLKGLPLLGGSRGEARVQGLARAKNWDVALLWPDSGEVAKPRLLVSLKSIMRNPRGTVPNRLDDLVGEVSSVQMLFPEVVIGYVAVLDYGAPTKRKKGLVRPEDMQLAPLYQGFKDGIEKLAVRRPPLWAQGLIEAAWIIEIDTRREDLFLDYPRTLKEGADFFDRLAELLRLREPLLFSPPPGAPPA